MSPFFLRHWFLYKRQIYIPVLVLLPNGRDGWSWADSKTGPKSLFWVSPRECRIARLWRILCCIPRPHGVSWEETRAARKPTGAHTWCQYWQDEEFAIKSSCCDPPNSFSNFKTKENLQLYQIFKKTIIVYDDPLHFFLNEYLWRLFYLILSIYTILN